MTAILSGAHDARENSLKNITRRTIETRTDGFSRATCGGADNQSQSGCDLKDKVRIRIKQNESSRVSKIFYVIF